MSLLRMTWLDSFWTHFKCGEETLFLSGSLFLPQEAAWGLEAVSGSQLAAAGEQPPNLWSLPGSLGVLGL